MEEKESTDKLNIHNPIINNHSDLKVTNIRERYNNSESYEDIIV